MPTAIDLNRAQILAQRRRVQALDARLPAGAASLRVAAWAGLQDSMPRAAVLSIHARVEGTEPGTWEDPTLIQVWGPRYQLYAIAREDLAPFTLGRLPDDAKGRSKAEDLAARLHEMLAGRATMTYGEAGSRIGVHGNQLRYAATTGTVLIRWAGARAPTIWTVPRPAVEPFEARLELARRYLHVYGPASPASFARWASLGAAQGRAAFDALGPEVTPVRTPLGDGWILNTDEAGFRAPPGPTASARLLPSGDSYFLLWGADRQLLVPEADRREELWTSRVWPGALLVRGEVVGTWRRDGANVSVQAWRPLSSADRRAIELEAASLPLPDLKTDIRVTWVS